MATSPYYSTSNQYIMYDFHVDELSTDIATNTSQVRIYVYAWRTNNYTTNQDGTCSVKVDGALYYETWVYPNKPISYNSDTKLFDKTITITHNADGSKTIYVEAQIQQPSYSSNFNGMNVTLSTIPRQANLTSVPNFNDEQNPTIQYSNTAGNSVTSLQACIGWTGAADIAYRDVSKTGTSYTFPLTTAERTKLRQATTTSNTKTVTFYLKTVIGGNTYYSTKTATLSIVNANPTMTGKSYKDSNNTTVTITQNNQYIIQNKSNLYFTLTGISALKSASISSVAVTVNGTTKNASLSGTTATLSFGTINVSQNTTASIVVTDSRGNKKTDSLTILVYAYSNPTTTASAKRRSNYYEDVTISASSTSYSSIGGKNSVTVTWKYKLSSAGSYTTGGSWPGNGSTTIEFDIDKAYNVQIVVADRLASNTYTLFVDVGIPILFIDRTNRRLGVNCFPSESIETDGKVRCTEVIQTSSIKVKTNITNLSHEEAEKILYFNAVSFDYKNPKLGSNKRGFIAEEVEEVLPNLVTPEAEDRPAALDYISMIPYLQTIIKDQEERIKALEEKIGGLNDGTD